MKETHVVPFFNTALDLREFTVLPRGELAAMAYRLAELQRDHDLLAEQLYRTIICGVPAPPMLVSSGSHTQCEFGRWYYSQSQAQFAANPLFNELGRLHQTIHQTAAHLDQLAKAGKQIQSEDFDAFASARIAFKDKLIVLRDKLAGAWSFLDPLMGVLRREAMQVILYKEHSRVKRGKYNCSIAMVDVDHFKKVNDRYGHQVGDKVLQSVAQTLLKHSRAMDAVFRYGGEELLICLPRTVPKKALQIMERLRVDIETRPIQVNDDIDLNVTISIGIASLQAETSIEAAIAHADQALYQAKSEGRNRTIIS